MSEPINGRTGGGALGNGGGAHKRYVELTGTPPPPLSLRSQAIPAAAKLLWLWVPRTLFKHDRDLHCGL